jgi:CDP-glucose 4,6-dehydratase
LWLNSLGAVVTGYALPASTGPSFYHDANVGSALHSDIVGDILDLEHLTKSMHVAQPEIVIHMAAQPLVRESYIDPVNTYTTNVIGTVNVFEAVRKINDVLAILNITTDKCYENREWDWGYREDEPMGGFDPYSSSKGCSELVTSAYRKSFFAELGISIATARAGNVIGGGDWAKDRIIPDAIRAFIKGQDLLVRNPDSIRPWQHVLEPLVGYIVLCQKLVEKSDQYSQAWNFGASDIDAKPVRVLADALAANWRESASWKVDDTGQPHEARLLKLDCSKAARHLNWTSLWGLSRCLLETSDWYSAWHAGEDMNAFTLDQISRYQSEYISR